VDENVFQAHLASRQPGKLQLPGLGIKTRGRLVQEHEFGIAHQCASHRQALSLAAREFSHPLTASTAPLRPAYLLCKERQRMANCGFSRTIIVEPRMVAGNNNKRGW